MRDREYLSLDFETRSTLKLPSVGLYKYAADPTTSIICMAWAIGWDMEPELWWPGEPLPEPLLTWTGPLRAWNAAFERLIWHHKLPSPVPALDRWYDTAAEAARLALPRKLGECARVLQVGAQKDDEGRRLMLKYSRPRKRKNQPDTWWDDPDDLKRIGEYCKTDVRVERDILAAMPPMRERDLWLLDQRVNDRGLKLDRHLVSAACKLVDEERERVDVRIEELTQGDTDSVTQTAALREWVNRHHPGLMDDFTKNTVQSVLKRDDLDPTVREVLELRQSAGRTSLAKWHKAAELMGYKDRVRGLLMYHGAGTGRWSGMLLQPQNFPRPTIEDVEEKYLDWVLMGGPGTPHDDRMEILVSLLRSMVIAEDEHRFMSGDYSQVELRILHWLSGGGYPDHPYERMAARIFGRPWTTIEKGSYEYGIGKNTELGCGYGMGWKRWREYVYLATGTWPDGEIAQKAVGAYREAKVFITSYWKDIERAAIAATLNPGQEYRVNNVVYKSHGQFLWAFLPSGRTIAYALPRIVSRETPWGAEKPALQYMGIDTRWGSRKWGPIVTYGGHLVENIVQATARDVMADAMLRLDHAGYPVVLTVHDEILCEVPDEHGSIEEFRSLMEKQPLWAKTAPIEADCWEGPRWRK